ncbi:hypothetical protein EDB84DRAFT_1440036 [Lactarius hengduanensis]|nr:hypothetical protein EDB84DRAFT_1440036 [Lactarius hengduanensis]
MLVHHSGIQSPKCLRWMPRRAIVIVVRILPKLYKDPGALYIPHPVPAGTHVPHVPASGVYNSARLVGDTPEVFPGELINTPNHLYNKDYHQCLSHRCAGTPLRPRPSLPGAGCTREPSRAALSLASQL